MTEDTARFLLGLLQAQQIQIGAPDFAQAVDRVQTALAELNAVLEATSRTDQVKAQR
jgi:hypothetical protein